MARDPKITVQIDGDSTGAQNALTKAQAATVGFSAAAGTAIANYAVQAANAAVQVGQEFVNQASALQQSAGAVEAVFGQYADTVVANSERAADAVGLSTSAYQDMAAVLGSQLKNAGTPMDQIAGKTDELVTLGADLASVYGGDVASAVDAVSSLMRGERDPIERYGVSINQASIEAYKAANGLSGLTGEAARAADQQATLALLFQQTADAQGNFGDESDTLAGAQARLNATWENTQAELGTALIPILTVAAQILTQVAEWVGENSTLFGVLVGVLAATAAAVWAVNVAMNANPLGLIITAVGLLIAALVLLISNWDSVVAAFKKGADQIAGFIDGIIGWIQDAIGWFTSLFSAADDAGGAASRANAAASPAPPAALAAAPPVGVATFSAVPAATSAAARSAAAATVRARTRQTADTGTNIVVNGALDPNAVARQISGLLKNRYARIGVTAAAGVRA